MTRIISGSARGRRLAVPASGVRPTVTLVPRRGAAPVRAGAGAAATALVENGAGLADHPELAAAVAALALDDRAEYLEKA